MQFDGILPLLDITAQPLMHDILLDAIPVVLRHLAAASNSSPQPYDDLCCGKAYHPLPVSRQFQASPPTPRVVPASRRLSLAQHVTPPATPPSTSLPATSALIPEPDHGPDESIHGPSGVPDICTSSPISMAHDASHTSGFTTATSPHAVESATATDIISLAIIPPIM
ncbi:hypothetical protein HPB52_000183 [Rhipicephalus sanguineus]|uniref:Uncharacterized protein n=1 Tax=Rhipicephalus sanguineus TaxID=34632 RepID=A0A9D4PPI2_RHISA|nr:hypothetical protein HPB52_000183 [Rhipicephalus sanguineus]